MKPTSDLALAKAYTSADKEQVRDLARSHTDSAIKTLVKLMKAPKTPAGVKRQCAMDILSQGWGRPDSRSDSGGITAEARGLVVNILKLSTNTVETTISDREDAIDIAEAVDMATMIADTVEATK
jgi:hypothetical protein